MSDGTSTEETKGNGVILIAGPTSSGKSALALALAETFGGVIINADSMQVYRQLEILTARPSAADQARVPHRLYGSLGANDPCSAGRWREMALAEIGAARKAHMLPILVGGTGLYFRALTEGLAPTPRIPPELRVKSSGLYERLGGRRFRAALAKRDPVMAERLSAADRQRLTRAWEVIEATGTSLAEWQSLPLRGAPFEDPFAKLLLAPPRQWLYARCDARFAAMVEGGALAEVEALLGLGLEADVPLMKAVGVRELARHLEGKITLEEAVAAGQRSTRRYAKRQMTWFRNQMADAHMIEAQDSKRYTDEVFPFICAFLLTGKS